MGATPETRLLSIAKKLRDIATDIEELVMALERPKEEKPA